MNKLHPIMDHPVEILQHEDNYQYSDKKIPYNEEQGKPIKISMDTTPLERNLVDGPKKDFLLK
jgi:hypothetical protein